MAGVCYSCGSAIGPPEPVSRGEVCSDCGAYIRCCLNCRFYDENAHNRCREPQSDFVKDREGGNFCEYFKLAVPREKDGDTGGLDEARRKFDALFKNNS